MDDIYQGAVPALVPFLVVDRSYTYAAVSGIVLASTVVSSVVQPLFGWSADGCQAAWLMAAGMGVAAGGVALWGWTRSYALTWCAIALSGFGVAGFHPEASRAARAASRGSAVGMSVFALGGNLGFSIGPALTTLLLLGFGGRGHDHPGSASGPDQRAPPGPSSRPEAGGRSTGEKRAERRRNG